MATNLKATTRIEPEKLQQFLEEVGSPLAPFSREILASNYWSMIVAITAAEQSFYKRPFHSPYNLWGMMTKAGCCVLMKFNNFPEAIAYMDGYLQRKYEQGRTTVESFNGHYVVPASDRWLDTVKSIKTQVENL